MANLPATLDYTNKDFDSINTRLDNLIRQTFKDWTDTQVSNFGNMLKELFANVGDILGFYQDNQGKESRLTDVELRKNAIALAKMLGFRPPGATAATVDVLITLDSIPVADVQFEDGQIVRTRDVDLPIEFQMLGGLTILAGSDPPQAFVPCEHSENAADQFDSSGLVDQEFQLSGVPFLDGSAVMLAANGAYSVVDNFLDSSSVDLHTTILVDENDRATTRYGNGVNGAVPIGTITTGYKFGGGFSGNVEANTITDIPGTFTDDLGNPHEVTCNNPVKAAGGTDRMNVAQIKERAPESVRVSDRTVALEDYQIGAEAVPGVARALMLTSDQTVGIPENRGFLHVIPEGGGLPSTALKDAVLTAVTITKPNTITFKVFVRDPLYKVIDIAATIFMEAGTSAATGAASVRANLEAFFAIQNSDGTVNTKIGFGFSGLQADGTPAAEIPLIGEVLAGIIVDNTGVRKVGDRDQDFTINGAHEDFALALFEFPVLGTVVLLDGDTGEIIPEVST